MPNFFWDSEPTLHPLYVAVREYLEIDPRIKVLNERCRVFLDLAEILSDSIADSKMSAITWIIIILIVISILVTVTEVGLRFAMLERTKREGGRGPVVAGPATVTWSHQNPVIVPPQGDVAAAEARPSDLEVLAVALGLQANASLDAVQKGIWDLKQVGGAGRHSSTATLP